MLSIAYLRHFIEVNAVLAYFLIILGIVIEGEIIVIMAGIGLHLGSLNILPVAFATIVGGSLKSILGYSFGFYINKKHSQRVLIQKTESRMNYFLPRFSEKPFISLFFARFLIMGLHWFALVYTGYKRIDIKTFIKAEASSLFVWGAGMLSLGYFASRTALSISRDVRKFIGILLIFFLLFFVLEKIIAFMIELFETSKTKDDSSK